MLGKSQINQGLLRVVRSKPFSIFYDLTGCLSPCEPYHSSPLKNGAKPSSTTSSCSVSFTPKLLPAKVMFDTLGYDYENGNVMFDLVRQPSLDNDLQGQVYFMKRRTIKYRREKNDITEP